MGKLLLALLLGCVAAGCRAEQVTMYLMAVPPLTLNDPERKGVAGDIALEALRRAGYDVRLEVVPSNRALAIVAHPSARNLLIIPLARVAPRENRYTWIAPLAKVNRAFFSLKKSVRTFGEARASFHAIGVSRGTAGLHILREEGFSGDQIRELNQAQTPPKMLLQHRIDAWYGPLAEGKELLLSAEAAAKTFVSPPLGPTYNYLACSLSCQPQMAARLAEALAQMEMDGSARSIREKYGWIDN
ncbi:polar amino acid transport system substrate-binding protein [Duganella sp. CF458]|uniref:substrate-binding periplasmic protein n=1 Tax=Duganella sp. CF458 TaxID=1884368 RepID=UPI0008DFEC9E|nr:transporter substrate-binding domain-containing protein [Duganella sp. CF458]SFF56942.1 polar amino acid transport system substrate-binding protein [Duganella sp. CF458]